VLLWFEADHIENRSWRFRWRSLDQGLNSRFLTCLRQASPPGKSGGIRNDTFVFCINNGEKLLMSWGTDWWRAK
jgi:hypothetical protein